MGAERCFNGIWLAREAKEFQYGVNAHIYRSLWQVCHNGHIVAASLDGPVVF